MVPLEALHCITINPSSDFYLNWIVQYVQPVIHFDIVLVTFLLQGQYHLTHMMRAKIGCLVRRINGENDIVGELCNVIAFLNSHALVVMTIFSYGDNL